jgi:hypothetical protein
MSEEASLHLYYSIIGLASLILFNGEITLLYNYTVFRHARYGVILTVPARTQNGKFKKTRNKKLKIFLYLEFDLQGSSMSRHPAEKIFVLGAVKKRVDASFTGGVDFVEAIQLVRNIAPWWSVHHSVAIWSPLR